MRSLPLLLLLGAACQQQQGSPARVTPEAKEAPAPAPASAWTAAQQGCVDRWLAAHGLDSFGSPHGTMYPGGTPLFDEATGRQTSRPEYLARSHPEVLRACGL